MPKKIERALTDNIHFMGLSAHSTPDFRTQNLSWSMPFTTIPNTIFMFVRWGKECNAWVEGKELAGTQVTYYKVKRSEGCPLRGMCHKAEGDRVIQVNHLLNQLKAKARELLTSEKGLNFLSMILNYGQFKTGSRVLQV